MRRAGLGVTAAALVVTLTTGARAGGYDTPMLYTARHMGMGGTAIGYVRDPSALFHNPAGLGHVRRTSLIGDLSLLIGDIHGSPDFMAQSVESDTTFAPFFLVGGAQRLHELVVVGVGLYPIASAGATYSYGPEGFEDRTSLLFVEGSVGVAVNLPENVRLGLGYRVTFVRLERFKGNTESDATPFIDFTLTGWDFLGLRAGAQWTPLPWLDVGIVYRHRVDVDVDSDEGIAVAQQFTDVGTEFTLPAKLSFGSRFDLEHLRGPHLAFGADLEYSFNSQNEGAPLEGDPVVPPGQPPAPRTSVPNVFEWTNSVTLRFGVEYRLLRNTTNEFDHVALRAGYVWDGKTANERYPTPFGTPPAPTNVLTIGGGYDGGPWQANVAYAYRFGSGTVTEEDLNAPGRRPCQFCGLAGEYAIHLNGIYIDASYEF